MIRASTSCDWKIRVNFFQCSLIVVAQIFCLFQPAAGQVAEGPGSSRSLHPEPSKPSNHVDEILFLEVSINEFATKQLGEFRVVHEDLAIRRDSLDVIGLRKPDGVDNTTEWIFLSEFTGLKWTLNRLRQTIALTVPVALLAREHERIGARLGDEDVSVPQTSVPALLMNYDLFASDFQRVRNLSAWTNLRLSGLGAATLSHSMLTQSVRSPLDNKTRHVRLDTTYSYEWPGSAVSLQLGDTQTSAVPWGRSLRIGGFRLGRDFSLQPYQSTTPVQLLRGEATIPSTVELYVNGLRQATQQVPPGAFLIEHTPTVQGIENAQVVVTDIHGNRRTMSFNLYGTPQLLKKGLWDWSVEGGVVRQKYAEASWAYGREFVASGSVRHGWTEDFTPDAHFEWTRGLGLVGLGGTMRLGDLAGTTTGALAASHSSSGTGVAASLGYQWATHGFAFSAMESVRSARYRDIASLNSVSGALRTSTIGVSAGSGWGQWGANYVQQRLPNNSTRFVSVNWSQTLGADVTARVNLAVDLESPRNGRTLSISLSWPLGGRRQMSSNYRIQGGKSNLNVEASQYPESITGWAWRLQGDQGRAGASGHAEASYASDFGYWSGGISQTKGESGPASYLSGSGSLFVGAGQVSAGARSDLSFAVVTTSGIPGIPVKLENRIVGITDANGQLFVPRLSPYQRNRIDIDTLELPADIRADKVTQVVTPQRNGGVLVHFPLRKVTSVELQAYDESGELIPAGTTITVEKRKLPGQHSPESFTTFMGHEGRIYLESPEELANLHIKSGKPPCTITLLNFALDLTQAVQAVTCRRQPIT